MSESKRDEDSGTSASLSKGERRAGAQSRRALREGCVAECGEWGGEVESRGFQGLVTPAKAIA